MQTSQIVAKFQPLRIETTSEKVGNVKNCKLDKNPQKFVSIFS